jgi:hypothetical protein
MSTQYIFSLALDTSEPLPSADVRNTYHNVERLLNHLTKAVSGEGHRASHWYWADEAFVQLATSPNGISEDQLASVVDLAQQGFALAARAAESGDIEWPEQYDDQAKEFVRLVLTRLKDVEAIRVTATDHEELVIQAANIGKVIKAKPVQRAFSSVEGVIDMISHRGGAYRFGLKEVGTAAIVQCYFPRERLQEVIGFFEQQVVVEGRVAYNKRGQSTSIRDVGDIYQRTRSRRLCEFRGAVPDITGSDDLDEFTERIRG